MAACKATNVDENVLSPLVAGGTSNGGQTAIVGAPQADSTPARSGIREVPKGTAPGQSDPGRPGRGDRATDQNVYFAPMVQKRPTAPD